jgi:hypothetical protein
MKNSLVTAEQETHDRSWTGVQDTKEHADSGQRRTLAVPTWQFAAFVRAVKDGQLTPVTSLPNSDECPGPNLVGRGILVGTRY